MNEARSSTARCLPVREEDWDRVADLFSAKGQPPISPEIAAAVTASLARRGLDPVSAPRPEQEPEGGARRQERLSRRGARLTHRITQPKSGLPLSRMERIILYLSSQGLSAQAIADLLFLSRRTVGFHRNHIFDKLGVRRIAAAVAAIATVTVQWPEEYARVEEEIREVQQPKKRLPGSKLATGLMQPPCDTLALCKANRQANTPCCGACAERTTKITKTTGNF